MEKGLCVALAGNPNTGKSTVFNALTGLKQHTGNWSGKTVGTARGRCLLEGKEAQIVDLPGIYSLFSDSAEERYAKGFLLSGQADVVLVVLDAGSLERNLPLALQTAWLHPRVVLCLNLVDEARKQGICVSRERLEAMTGLPVVETVAREGKGLEELKASLCRRAESLSFFYEKTGEDGGEPALDYLRESLPEGAEGRLPREIFCRQVLEGSAEFYEEMMAQGKEPAEILEWMYLSEGAGTLLEDDVEVWRRKQAAWFLEEAERIAGQVCRRETVSGGDLTHRLDRLLLQSPLGFVWMGLLLALVFWITVAGANLPSSWLMSGFQTLGGWLRQGLEGLGTPLWLEGLLMDGMYLTLSWVVAVMLPPMAIFFPLFTLLEDLGLLPRIAFLLDGFFQRAGAHGKQALTLCMGFGCNAAGVTACRIIESPRERLIAILTNVFVPCNGRFPTIILLCSIFLSAGLPFLGGAAVCAVVVFSVTVTLAVSFFLSRTLLKGTPSAFVLELPPYRRPQIRQVLLRSLLDRTIFVLGRAVTVALPAGAFLWVCANVSLGDATLLGLLADFLDPLGSLMGLSGVILAAFLLGMPANEIVLPILFMVYSQTGMLTEAGTAQAGALLAANGWTWATALCAVIFSLNHFPCATTLWTIRKETGSSFWMAVAFCLPTLVGMLLCMAVHGGCVLFSLVF
ncbi:ferrous iron transport protein B [Anaerotignum lactatifermentans]|uniref:Ferrous iron transport protein B n=1 Tax=Anaerotignum lactatifermentans TaxID=160404 RepID=A0ABS2GDH2_9FIRM|nr:ferrous iron transport protein B [Anaerotignum lactatifermentans]MBM6830101.1 ferrous iron transport protein B [Anaerotignum lactatifermentans]MBM6878667.1 ferrous iron transport protein B [Anaerotignum lactatifermentans]MBM6951732.1 ferrous iron transport protein B [Anaerotignum lactatifermentans]